MEIVTKLSPFALFFIMFSLGLNCNFHGLIKVFKNFKSLSVGIFLQIFLLPIVGLLLAYFLTIPANYKIGIILITCVPSAVFSNYLTKLINGNVHLSISLTVVSSLFSFISIPLILTVIAPSLNLINLTQFNFSFYKISLFLLFMSSVPILLGITISTKFSNFAKLISPFLSKISLIIFVLVILLAWYLDFEFSMIAYKELIWTLLLLMAIIFICANLLIKLFNIDQEDKKTIILEIFIQNGAMAILIGSTIFGLGDGFLFMSAIYGLFQYKIFLLWFLWKQKLSYLLR